MSRSVSRVIAFTVAALVLSGLPAAANSANTVGPPDEDLRKIAAINAMTVAEVRQELDGEARVGANGRLYYVDPAPAPLAGPTVTPTAAFPLPSTFLLHSKPGSAKTIYLDFNGGDVTGSAWNQPPDTGVSLRTGFFVGWDSDHDGPAFNNNELAVVQDVFLRVAEDFAAFDVDVTTEPPTSDQIVRDSPGGTLTRVV